MKNEIKLKLFEENFYADSRDVAKLVNKRHSNLLRDIDRYIPYLSELNVPIEKCFVLSDYVDKKGEKRPEYLITLLGCHIIALQLNGLRGMKFILNMQEIFTEQTMQKLREDGLL